MGTDNTGQASMELAGVNTQYTSDIGYDPLFNGFTRGYGTWFQGEVEENFAGPFNTNTNTQRHSLTAIPREMLALGGSQ